MPASVENQRRGARLRSDQAMNAIAAIGSSCPPLPFLPAVSDPVSSICLPPTSAVSVRRCGEPLPTACLCVRWMWHRWTASRADRGRAGRAAAGSAAERWIARVFPRWSERNGGACRIGSRQREPGVESVLASKIASDAEAELRREQAVHWPWSSEPAVNVLSAAISAVVLAA